MEYCSRDMDEAGLPIHDYYVLRTPNTTVYYPLEQPIFTTKAHVFQIDPSTKKKWLPASTQAVNVSYYYDSTRNTHRIISVEGSKAVINSTISPNMTFTKTSQKFGQWTDPRANTVYGLGFASEAELAKFIEKFKEVKEASRSSTNGDASNGSLPPSSPDVTHSPAQVPKHNNSASTLSTQNDVHVLERKNSGSTISSLPANASEAQLKYENDRLKIALAQSSANAKKWEIELQTLKNNNVRLTTALQESTANVEEWKKQLAMYKEESARMKKRVMELEKGAGGDITGNNNLQQRVNELTDKMHALERDNQSKQEELTEVTRKLDEMKTTGSENHKLSERVKTLEKENDSLKGQLSSIQLELDTSHKEAAQQKQTTRSLYESLNGKLSELNHIQDQLKRAMQQT